MAVSLGNALSQLAKMQKTTKLAKQKALSAKETSEEKAEYVFNSMLRFGAAAAAGAADAMVDDTMAGLTPSELGGLALGGMSMSGMLGKGTKSARSMAEGALCGAFYRRAFVYWKPGEGAPQLTPGDQGGGAVSGGHIDQAEEHDILVALAEEQRTGLSDAAELVD